MSKGFLGYTSVNQQVCFCSILLVLLLSVWNCSDSVEVSLQKPPVHKEGIFLVDRYVGANTCAECHDQVHEKWEDSHHFHAMELPNEQTIRADFNNSTFENYGVITKFFREGKKYLVKTENQEGEIETFEVAYTFGWEPLQQYLIKFPDGRLQVLPTCWDVEKKEWYHL